MTDGNSSRADEGSDEVRYDPDTGRYDIYERSGCDNVVLRIGRDDPPMSCHGRPME
ncbi:hypothetical protein [Halorubrum sp. BOL3-1]|uniref:hypothetical protein n=1 Tax=Halorubrum sp. BOL3-1 TaxID=2497325 RepID=UPI001F4F7022|nr:hypothetical protein [Halorubrum sp. BOL3-1]